MDSTLTLSGAEPGWEHATGAAGTAGSVRGWEASAATHPGRVRRVNEDTLVCHVEAGVFVVCDGMGGAAAGELASHLAAEAALGVLAGRRACAAAMHEAAREANEAVYQAARRDRRLAGMGTTLLGLALEGGRGWLAHVGDSRCYRWSGGDLLQLTRDHSLVEEQIQLGRMTPAQARRSPMSHLVTRAVGTRPEVRADVIELALRPGDLLLLASDGLTRELREPAIARTLAGTGDLHTACRQLIAAANAAGGRDNITCVLVRFF